MQSRTTLPRHAASASNASSECNLESLLPELLGRIFGKLCLKERCRVIPLLNKDFNRIHTQHLPQPRLWRWEADKSITESRVAFFEKSASLVEKLQIHSDKLCGQGRLDCYVRLLDAAAVAAPNLQRLEAGGLHHITDNLPVMRAISCISHLTQLQLTLWSLVGAEQLATLKNLQVLDLHIGWFSVSETSTGALKTALSSLPSLCQLSISTAFAISKVFNWCSLLTVVTQLRALRLRCNSEVCMDESNKGGDLDKSFAALKKLSFLSIAVPWRGLGSFPDLPLLRSLDLDVTVSAAESSLPGLPYTALQRLSSLTMTTSNMWCLPVSFHTKHQISETVSLLATFMTLSTLRWEVMRWPASDALIEHSPCPLAEMIFLLQLDRVFSSAMPALCNLQQLTLAMCGLRAFPASVANCLKCLSYLNLDWNEFDHFPVGVVQISSLQTLSLFGNTFMLRALRLADIGIISAMPKLQSLTLWDRNGWSADNAFVLKTMVQRIFKERLASV